MKIQFNKNHLLLIVACLILWLTFFYAKSQTVLVKSKNYDTKVAAANQMNACMETIKKYKLEQGIPLHPDDINETGMIGDNFNRLTTTLGYLPAKRTTTNADMAAYIVELFNEAGLKKGDIVGVSASGSFPGLNIAVLVACDKMGLKAVTIASVGASTYGANNIELSSPEILKILANDGLISDSIVGVTFGGDNDTGTNLDPQLLKNTENRLNQLGLNVHKEKDFKANIKWRNERLEQNGKIDAFVSIGGNTTASNDDNIGQVGLLKYSNKNFKIDDKSGLIERYYNEGIPVIRLINIEKLVNNAGLPFDSNEKTVVGKSDIYYNKSYPKNSVVLGIALSLIILIVFYRKRI